MLKGFEQRDTNLENLAVMVAKGFERQDEKFAHIDERFTQINEQFKNVDENFKKVRRDILEIGDRFVSRHEFEKFVSRFNALEAKVKGKSK